MPAFSIPFYGWTTFHCTERPHFVYHSSADGHLGCGHLLAVLSSAVMNIHTQVFMWLCFLILLDTCRGVEFMDHVATPCLTFWELWGCSPKRLPSHPLRLNYNSTGSNFLHATCQTDLPAPMTSPTNWKSKQTEQHLVWQVLQRETLGRAAENDRISSVTGAFEGWAGVYQVDAWGRRYVWNIADWGRQSSTAWVLFNMRKEEGRARAEGPAQHMWSLWAMGNHWKATKVGKNMTRSVLWRYEAEWKMDCKYTEWREMTAIAQAWSKGGMKAAAARGTGG